MIPKILHYVWIGAEKKGLAAYCTKQWTEILPKDWEIKEWNYDTFNFEEVLKENKFFKEVYDRKLYAFVADYIRAAVLYKYGGVYVDTDVTIIKEFDENMLKCKMFLPIQNENLVEPAIWGSEKGHDFAKEMIDFYDKEIWESPEYSMPHIMGKLLRRKYGIKGFPKKEEQKIFSTKDGEITFYPEEYFIPFEYGTRFFPTCITPKTTTVHWFNGSWCADKNLSFLENKCEYMAEEEVKTTVNKPNTNVECYKKEKIKLFNFLTILKIKKYNNKTKIYLFGFIPIIKIKK